MELKILPGAFRAIKKLNGRAGEIIKDHLRDLSDIPRASLTSAGTLVKLGGTNLYEIKLIKKGESLRIVTDMREGILYVLHVFPKKSQNAKSEIQKAIQRSKEIK